MKRVITEEKILEFREMLLTDEKSSGTITKYIRDVEAFHKHVGDKEISKEIVINYKHYLVENYAPASVNSMIAAVNRFLREQGWYDCVVKALKIQRQSFRPKEKELSKEEYYRLLEAAKQKKNKRLYLLMQTICATGIRVGELRFITVEAVQKGRATVSLKGKTREVLIPRELIAELKRYIKIRNIKCGSVFITRYGNPLNRNNILYEMKALCEKANVERSKVYPHNLRHLFASLYYRMEKNLSHLADILGHSNINTTRIYTSISGEEQQFHIERLGLVIGSSHDHRLSRWLE